MASRYYMKISQVIDNDLEDLCSCIPYDLLNIELNFRYVVPRNLGIYTEIYHRTATFYRHMILFEEHGWNSIRSLFADMGAPPDFLQVVISDILSFAWEVDQDPVNRGRKVKKLLVEIEVLAVDDEIDQAIDDSLNTLNFKPATRSSVQALKRVRVGDDEDSLLPLKKRKKVRDESSKKQCTICLEEFSDGEEATSMPCGHVFHDDCIVRWLETSHYCPLCRYQMPC